MEGINWLLLVLFAVANFNAFNSQTSGTNYCSTPVTNDTGVCFCDLTSYCDVDCCCDTGCSSTDILSFSSCQDQYNLNASCTCLASSVMMANNSILIGNQVSYAASGSTCFYQNTYSNLVNSSSYYVSPQVTTCYQLSESVVSGYVESSVAGNVINTNYDTAYSTSQPLLVVYGTSVGGGYYTGQDFVGFLPLPKPINGQAGSPCVDNNAASFLNSESWSCNRYILDISGSCTAMPALSASSYYSNMNIANQVNSSTWITQSGDYLALVIDFRQTYSYFLSIETAAPWISSVKFVGITPSFTYVTGSCPGNNGSTTSAPATSLVNTSYCDCVVKSVSYQINVESGLISSASVAIVIGTLTTSPFQQSFSITYNNMQTAATTPLQKSGSPGYETGLPVLGLYNAANYSAIANSSWVTSQNCITSANGGVICPLRALSAPPAFDCSSCLTNPASCAQSILFGVNYRSGCTFAVSSSNFSSVCSLLQNQSAFLMSGLPYPTGGSLSSLASYLPSFGVFGDLSTSISTFNNMSTWQPATVFQLSGAKTDNYRHTAYVCTNLTRSLTIEVLYTNTGSLAQPAVAIVGLAYQFGEPETLIYNFDAQHPQTQFIEVAVSVTFTAANTLNTLPKGGLPQNYPVQPNWSDFFYLLYVDQFVLQFVG